jgi:gp16 family phage-associated protein
MFSSAQLQACRTALEQRGKSVRRWAAEHGLPEGTVYAVLRGKNPGRIGAGHQVAVALGLKAEVGGELPRQLEQAEIEGEILM